MLYNAHPNPRTWAIDGMCNIVTATCAKCGADFSDDDALDWD